VAPVARLRLLVLLAALGLAACGGGGDDEGDVEQTVRDFVEATNERDGDKLCGELLSREYKEKATGATGDRVDEACRQQLELITGLKLELVSIGKTKIDGERARVRAVIENAGQRLPRVFRLVKEDGSWKLDGSAG
jgi:ABC-type glycerol-3-phosphate transport system substrate-binding protein